MTRHILLIRGINVGGKARLPMGELRALLAELGHGGAKTLLQTGNIVLDDDRPPGQLEPWLEGVLERRFGFRPEVMARSSAEWRGLIDVNPFPAEAEREPERLAAVVLKRAPDPTAVEALKAAADDERAEAVGRTAYIHYPRGLGRSRLAVERKLRVPGTGRNWNTVLKLAELAGV